MSNYIATVETNFEREVVCSVLDVLDIDGKTRKVEISSLGAIREFVKCYQSYFPHSRYHIYKLVEEKDELKKEVEER